MAGGLYDVKVQSFSGATMPEYVKVKKCKDEKPKDEERRTASWVVKL